MFRVDRNTQLCLSLSTRPSEFGNRFHNQLFQSLGLNYLYKTVVTDDLEGAVGGVRALGIRGCAISMPFKERVLTLLDHVDGVAQRIGAVNTVVNYGDYLVGYNTDHLAVRESLECRRVSNALSVVVFGSGGMARAILFILHEMGFADVVVVSRNDVTGPALATRYGYRWSKGFNGLADIIFNATPVGMRSEKPENAMAFPQEMVVGACLILDAIADPPETALIKAARSEGKPYIDGFEIIVSQAREQFHLYTGIEAPEDLVAEASEFARCGTDIRETS